MFAFLLIVGVSYFAVASSLIRLVGDYLFDDRMRQDRSNTNKLAQQLAPLYQEADFILLQQEVTETLPQKI